MVPLILGSLVSPIFSLRISAPINIPTGNELDDMESFNYEGSKDVLTLMDDWVKEHLPTVGDRIDSYCHPYTMTSDSYFVMDKVADNVALFSGGSGRAFKFGPLLGDCVSSLLTGEESPVDDTTNLRPTVTPSRRRDSKGGVKQQSC